MRVAARADAVSSLRLGVVESGVGARDERDRVLTAQPLGDADRARLSGGSRRSQALGRRESVLELAPGQYQRELLAAVASEHVGGAKLGVPGARASLQQLVSRRMTQLIVEPLEVIEVEEGDAQSAPIAVGTNDLAQDVSIPRATVWKLYVIRRRICLRRRFWICFREQNSALVPR